MGVGSGGAELNLPRALRGIGVPGMDTLGSSCASSGLAPCERPGEASSLLPPLRRCCLKRGGCQITAAFSQRHGQPGRGSCLAFFPHVLKKGLLLLQEHIEICSRDVGFEHSSAAFPKFQERQIQALAQEQPLVTSTVWPHEQTYPRNAGAGEVRAWTGLVPSVSRSGGLRGRAACVCWERSAPLSLTKQSSLPPPKSLLTTFLSFSTLQNNLWQGRHPPKWQRK